jgi:hypothetical protein
MTGTNCDVFTHKSSRSYLNHLLYKNKYKSVLRLKGEETKLDRSSDGKKPVRKFKYTECQELAAETLERNW